ncbi:hypothetical protein RHO12_06080 [Orbus sturtevantii]|uniref:hypothetical protein n=1 Tax=Orbus sturtevantii TaxID=3074109 RepID=UPI00370DD3F5
MKKMLYLIIFTIASLIMVVILYNIYQNQTQKYVTYSYYDESKKNIANYIVTLVPKGTKKLTAYLEVNSRDNSQAYYIESQFKNGEIKELDITQSQIKKLFGLVKAFNGDNFLQISPYRPYDINSNNYITVDLDPIKIDISYSEKRTVHSLPNYITEEEMYELDEKIQHSQDQYFKGIGIRFSGDNQ